jgi:hypothetical protein
MSNENPPPKPAGGPADDLSPAELSLGRVLVIIHQLLPRLADAESVADVQAAFRKAAACLEGARQSHENDPARRVATGRSGAGTPVDSETLAIIAAAIATVLDRPHKLVSVQPATIPVPYLNVWAFEGRTQIFHSHKIR